MALKSNVIDLNDVEENYRGLYIPQTVKGETGQDVEVFVLDVSEIEKHPSVRNLHSAHTRSKSENSELKSVKANLEAQLAASPSNDRDFKKTAADLKSAETKIASQQTFIQQMLTGDGLAHELTRAGIDPKFVPAAAALLGKNIKVLESGGTFRATIVDRFGGERDLQDFVPEWAQSDEGRIFAVSEPTTAVQNANKRLSDTGPNPFAKDTWNMTEQGAVMKADAAKADRLAKAAGHKDAKSARREAAK